MVFLIKKLCVVVFVCLFYGVYAKSIYVSSAVLGIDAGQRAWVPPDPVPNSEVKPCSVPNCSAVFGRVNSGKLALPLIPFL